MPPVLGAKDKQEKENTKPFFSLNIQFRPEITVIEKSHWTCFYVYLFICSHVHYWHTFNELVSDVL